MFRRPDTDSAYFKMRKARGDLVQSHPFFGLLALRLQLKENSEIPVMATDGKYIFYNPEVVKGMPGPYVLGVVAHEVLHCALQHVYRRKFRDPEKWNRAIDYVVNSILLKERLSLPPSRLFNSKYANMSAEEIYTKLPDETSPNCGSDGQDDWNLGSCLDPSAPTEENPQGVSQAELDQRAQEWKIQTKQAALAAKGAGNLPKDLEHMVDKLLEPKIPWRDQLWYFLSKTKPGRISWTRPNRRLLKISTMKGEIIPVTLPSRIREPTGDIIIAFDTSGSISHEERVQFASEINQIHKTIQPELITVLYIDTRVTAVDKFEVYDTIKITDRGGGGTSFQPAFDWIDKHNPDIDALVYLTDGYPDHWPNEVTKYPVCWVITNRDVVPPWGEHIILDID